MKKNIFKKVGIGMTLGLALLPFLALAATQPVTPLPLITSSADIWIILNRLLGWLGSIVMLIGVIMLLWAAILYLTAGASETTHTKAKSVLIYAIVGIAVAILAFSVRPFLETFLGGRF